jgi:hypothetical protein
MTNAMTHGHTIRGKWSQPGVPHKGWTCVGVEDLEEPSELCGMCESIEIRFVHLMEHPDYPETLGVGCICAEHMEQDHIGPSLREKKLRSKAQRRKTWGNRDWRISARGNIYLNTEGFNLTVFETSRAAPDRWGLKVTHRQSGREQFGKRRYGSEDAAKRAALDALIWAKEHLVD